MLHAALRTWVRLAMILKLRNNTSPQINKILLFCLKLNLPQLRRMGEIHGNKDHEESSNKEVGGKEGCSSGKEGRGQEDCGEEERCEEAGNNEEGRGQEGCREERCREEVRSYEEARLINAVATALQEETRTSSRTPTR